MIHSQGGTSGAGSPFRFENWNMWDGSPAWREATLGPPAERLAKFKDPVRRQAMIEQPPMLFPFVDTVILRTRSEKFLPAKGTKLPDAARILGYEDMGELLIDMAVADELTTPLQTAPGNTHPALQA